MGGRVIRVEIVHQAFCFACITVCWEVNCCISRQVADGHGENGHKVSHFVQEDISGGPLKELPILHIFRVILAHRFCHVLSSVAVATQEINPLTGAVAPSCTSPPQDWAIQKLEAFSHWLKFLSSEQHPRPFIT